MNPEGTKLSIRLNEIKITDDKLSTRIEENTKLFYSISDGDSQFFSSKTEAIDQTTKSFKFKEKFTINLNTGFEELSFKVMSLTGKDE